MIEHKDLKEVQEVFFQDPRWKTVEDVIYEYITPLLDMSTIDTTKDGETVRAEIIGRTLAYETLKKFLDDAKLVGHSKAQITNSPFR